MKQHLSSAIPSAQTHCSTMTYLTCPYPYLTHFNSVYAPYSTCVFCLQSETSLHKLAETLWKHLRFFACSLRHPRCLMSLRWP